MQCDFLLLDTSVLSEARRAVPVGEVIDFLRSLPDEAIAVPLPAIFELERGARELMRRDRTEGSIYLSWLEKLIWTRVYIPPATVEIWRMMALMATVPHLRSFWRDADDNRLQFGIDPAIAATSIHYGIPIATRDVKDYMRIHEHFPLPGVYEPYQDRWVVSPPPGYKLLRGDPALRNVLFDLSI